MSDLDISKLVEVVGKTKKIEGSCWKTTVDVIYEDTAWYNKITILSETEQEAHDMYGFVADGLRLTARKHFEEKDTEVVKLMNFLEINREDAVKALRAIDRL